MCQSVAGRWDGLVSNVLRIRQVASSNISTETDHLEVFPGFLQQLQANSRVVGDDWFIVCHFQLIYHRIRGSAVGVKELIVQ